MWFRSRRADVYLIDTTRLTRKQELEACRAALEIVRPDVDRFQCDIPWDNRGSWPREVVEDATVLAPLPKGPATSETYQLTGWVSGFTDHTWEAFVTFAPYAFASDAWTADMSWLINVSDEGTSVAVRLSPERLTQLQRSIGGGDVVAAGDWSRLRQKEWRARQNLRRDSN